MLLLAAVTLVSMAIAGGATLIGATETQPMRLTDRSTGYAEQAPPADTRTVNATDQRPVRVVGSPFVPNTNPRER